MSVIEDIGNIITWYQGQYAGAPIEQYMDAKSKLLTLLWKFAGEVADAKHDSIMAENTRRANFHEHKMRLIEEGNSGVAAESMAEVVIRGDRAHEGETNALFFKMKQLSDIAVKIAEDITQRISVLRKERENG